ncbi:HAAS signaling domain-containing protein [Spirilliplanes yamanashiensis]|uniref:Uncharacterized protein n=1 Tax=Spirilliplanes yamanashiensis TaxID=42233 RepID=A0A8J3Y868_9ACTN|nr:hypothetical protein [Spirilliplanes yamanashiensis]MDP9815517.1 hypothetical protein [Spirilliplanes yamanashiensis]GIJ03771.1 hypothetical protein Sya03_31230 [Spirilliplanes yamanashiensis]
MTTTNTTSDDAVREYLRAVDLRLGGLPLLQRRELVTDLETHIAAVRADRGAHSEGEVLEILERLGSPDVVAAAAYAEAGPSGAFPLPPPAPGARPYAADTYAAEPYAPAPSRAWVPVAIGLAIVTGLLFIAGVVALMFVARGDAASSVGPVPAPAEPYLPAPPAEPALPDGLVRPGQ